MMIRTTPSIKNLSSLHTNSTRNNTLYEEKNYIHNTAATTENTLVVLHYIIVVVTALQSNKTTVRSSPKLNSIITHRFIKKPPISAMQDILYYQARAISIHHENSFVAILSNLCERKTRRLATTSTTTHLRNR